MRTNEFDRGAERLRAEARRLADIRADLRRAMRERVWQGPAAERFAASIGRRCRELDEQHDLLAILAGRLDTAADAVRRQQRAGATS